MVGRVSLAGGAMLRSGIQINTLRSPLLWLAIICRNTGRDFLKYLGCLLMLESLKVSFLIENDHSVSLQNRCPFWLVEPILWPHCLWGKELGRRPGGFLIPTTQTSRSRWRVVVGRTLPASWWTDRLRPLGAPGSRGHPCSFL